MSESFLFPHNGHNPQGNGRLIDARDVADIIESE